ncbi:flavodoxin [Streptococcus sp. NLN76]|uniref:flavodoxin n=1 Tax=Streptococcus sp. NLN76 TaxID=2822800 RepID=UPI0018AC0B48|nr:flavodoxin [Streptococcus sp. NLN76]MBF8970003.1 flavodoxin [Streptococcus sp. NLN76]
MKKLGLILVTVLAAGIVVACGRNSSQTVSSDSSSTGATSASVAKIANAGNDRVLVAYYSESGNTQEVAETIASETGGDLFRVELANPFTDEDLNWNDRESRIVREYENESERSSELQVSTPDNWADYDTVFIGYPMWWQQAAWPLQSFIRQNNFEGKTVIPFATSMSSEMGDSGQNLAALGNGGDWQEGRRFSSSGNNQAVMDWVRELGY